MLHINGFNENIQSIARLLQIHEELTGNLPGRRNNVEVLNKSGIVLLVACWESFVEDLAVSSFDFLLENAHNPTAFPPKVLARAGRLLRDSKDERAIWSLAEDGWRQVLIAHKAETLEKHLGTFNTPRTAQIDGLYETLLGIPELSSNWHWQKMTQENAKQKLEELITVRGDIAHRVKTGKAVTKENLNSSAYFIQRLGAISSNVLCDFLHSQVGEAP